MVLEPQEQFKKFLAESKDILILIPENPSADAVGASWALYYFLEKKWHDYLIQIHLSIKLIILKLSLKNKLKEQVHFS